MGGIGTHFTHGRHDGGNTAPAEMHETERLSLQIPRQQRYAQDGRKGYWKWAHFMLYNIRGVQHCRSRCTFVEFYPRMSGALLEFYGVTCGSFDVQISAANVAVVHVMAARPARSIDWQDICARMRPTHHEHKRIRQPMLGHLQCTCASSVLA